MKQNFLKILPLIFGFFTSLQAMENEMDVETVSKKRGMEIDINAVGVETVSPKKHRKNDFEEMDVENTISKINPFEVYGVPTDLNIYISDLIVGSITSLIKFPVSIDKKDYLSKLDPATICILLRTVFKNECLYKNYTFNQGNRHDLSTYNGGKGLDDKIYKTLCKNEHEDQSLKYWLEKVKICRMTVPLQINSMRNGIDFGTNMALICTYLNQMSSLDLECNYIDLDGYSNMLNLLGRNTTLTALKLSGNYMNLPQIENLGVMLGSNTTLTSLTVSLISRDHCNKERVATKVATGLSKNTTLTHLNITFNDLEIYVGDMVSEGLKYNTTLKSLVLRGDYGDKAITNICSLLKNNTVLTTLNLTGTDHLPKMIDSLIKNKTLTSLVLSNYGLCDYSRGLNYERVRDIPNLALLEKVGYKIKIETKEDVMYDGLGSTIGHVIFLLSRGGGF